MERQPNLGVLAMRQFDSSLIPNDAAHDAHYARQCGKCLEDLSDEDIEIEAEEGDGMCECCRSLTEAIEL
jgi:hypothetical protein